MIFVIRVLHGGEMQIVVFWVIARCILVAGNDCFGGHTASIFAVLKLVIKEMHTLHCCLPSEVSGFRPPRYTAQQFSKPQILFIIILYRGNLELCIRNRQQCSGYISFISNFNREDGGSTPSETFVSVHQNTRTTIQKNTNSG
jgi:hypothetical protein